MTQNPDDVDDVLLEVYPAHPKWYGIGLTLRVPVTTLDEIRAQFDDTSQCLQEALKDWFKRDTTPTWRALVDALRSHGVRELALAERIERKYLTLQETTPTQGT